MISAETARRQARRVGVPLALELDLLVTHGTLHLVGYDDRDPLEADLMHRARARHPGRRPGAPVARAAPPVSKRGRARPARASVGRAPRRIRVADRAANAGKSTLLNRLVGEKLAIVSPRPQTTRNRITGILTRPDAQVVFVDTPGLHVGGGKLGEFMQQTARRAVEDVDVICLVVDATGRTGPDDLVLDPLRAYGGPAVCALNKTDLVPPKAALLPLLDRWRAAHAFARRSSRSRPSTAPTATGSSSS